MDIHLYLLCFRTEALVASHLTPEHFGAYMAVGPKKRTQGHVLFFEIDPSLRSPELNLQHVEEHCVPYPDGSPRASKYMSVYRVVEHVPLGAYGTLFLTTRDGRVLGIDGHRAGASTGPERLHMYDELCPLTPRVVSRFSPVAFVEHLTSDENAVSVPRIFFAEKRIDRDANGQLWDGLPYADLEHIEDCLRELEEKPSKATKTVNRNPPLLGFFNTVSSGFYVGDSTATLQYPFPDRERLDVEHHDWWRSASQG